MSTRYYCPYCEAYYDYESLPSDLRCEDCGTALEYDDLPEDE